MIPFWLLTILHYGSLAAAVLILVLLAWQGLRPQDKDSQSRTAQASITDDPTEIE